jgi:hypothetical protein
MMGHNLLKPSDSLKAGNEIFGDISVYGPWVCVIDAICEDARIEDLTLQSFDDWVEEG